MRGVARRNFPFDYQQLSKFGVDRCTIDMSMDAFREEPGRSQI